MIQRFGIHSPARGVVKSDISTPTFLPFGVKTLKNEWKKAKARHQQIKTMISEW
ncbi:MAG: hypothetical protein R2860_05650 [Desulfobacterales bacterium]